MFSALLAKMSGERLQDHWSSGYVLFCQEQYDSPTRGGVSLVREDNHVCLISRKKGSRLKEYLHLRNRISRRSTSSGRSRCSTSRGKYSSPSSLTGNTNIDTSGQKGGVPGFSGCVEHTSAITQLMNLLINPKTELRIHLPSSRGFVDDITLTTTTHV